MNPDQITIFISFTGASEAATKAYRSNTGVHSFLILPGEARWSDGTRDRGHKVRLLHKDGSVSFL